MTTAPWFHIEAGPDTPRDAVQALQHRSAARVLPIVQRPPVPLWRTLLRCLAPRVLIRSSTVHDPLPGHLREQALRQYAMEHPADYTLEGFPVDNPDWAARHTPLSRPMRYTDREVL